MVYMPVQRQQFLSFGSDENYMSPEPDYDNRSPPPPKRLFTNRAIKRGATMKQL